MGTDMNENVDVAGAALRPARVALSAEPDPLAVVDPPRDLDLERPFFQTLAAPGAVLARRAQHPATPAALRARLRADELAEHGARHGLEAPDSAASGARLRRRSRRSAASCAGRARDRHRHGD